MFDSGLLYHLRSKYIRDSRLDKPTEEWPASWRTIDYKTYPRFPSIALPTVEDILVDQGLLSILQKRSSCSTFATDILPSISVEKLTMLLVNALGKKKDTSHRVYPAAGGLYSIETYVLLAYDVGTLKSGVYHYEPKNDKLIHLVFTDTKKVDEIKSSFPVGTQISLLFTSRYRIKKEKYSEKAYRFVCIEAGVMLQNIYLVATLLNIGCCAVGQMDEDMVNSMLDIDGQNEFLLTTVVLGK